jgi:predicted cupin superfamily sugar epimerase
MSDARKWITQLGLRRHPEGGFFAESYRSPETIPPSALPVRYGGPRSFGTAIYFLLAGDDFSALHRIASDELWHFYFGSPLTVHLITPEGTHVAQRLGPDFPGGERFQMVVPAGCWFGATVENRSGFALVGCTVAPGFDFADFHLGKRAELLAEHPRLEELITRLTRR